VRRDYPRAVMVGGVDKREIAKDRAAIDAEVAYVCQILDQGGYIPTIDHAIPPDVSYDNFRYYLEVKRKALAG
ncbi:MAG TPA: hypothetical protein PLZ36_18105, partial [Armatimonadota bacterium]|nr:hypothetical protein [Armatimonadota bacterium]